MKQLFRIFLSCTGLLAGFAFGYGASIKDRYTLTGMIGSSGSRAGIAVLVEVSSKKKIFVRVGERIPNSECTLSSVENKLATVDCMGEKVALAKSAFGSDSPAAPARPAYANRFGDEAFGEDYSARNDSNFAEPQPPQDRAEKRNNFDNRKEPLRYDYRPKSPEIPRPTARKYDAPPPAAPREIYPPRDAEPLPLYNPSYDDSDFDFDFDY